MLTAAIVFGPLVAVVVAASALWDHGISLRDALTAVVFYLVAGFGITVGYHRLFTHRSFRAVRPLRIALAVAGSFAVEGGVVGWVANHRRHHAFADRDGDPHSPTFEGSGARTVIGGLWHAHIGWLFKPTFVESAFAKDIRSDRDLRTVDRLFPVLAAASFLAPFALGWVLTGTVSGGLVTFLWAGVLRIFVLHHVTWSINSICHTFGARPWATRDRSTNVALLAPLSFGDPIAEHPSSQFPGHKSKRWHGEAASGRLCA
ncbi:MAG: acyl-CoA desaturase [Acidimicrobiia bacterium]|nr:acyl-CoA desaturase [Acidimicrobiia bacterium]